MVRKVGGIRRWRRVRKNGRGEFTMYGVVREMTKDHSHWSAVYMAVLDCCKFRVERCENLQ